MRYKDNVLIVAFICFRIHVFGCVNIHVFVCATIRNIVYCKIYFVLKGRELKERESEGLYRGHNLKFGSWGGLRGATFLRVFSYNTRFPGTEPSCYRRANCISCHEIFCNYFVPL